MKIALTDLETTGLSNKKHEIIEIGCVVFDSETFEISDSFNIKVKPMRIKDAEPKALEINGYDPDEWKDAIGLKEALSDYAKRTSGTTFMAHNVSFDWGFLEEASFKTRVFYEFSDHRRLDLLSMAYAKIPKNKVQGYSLKTICAYLGIAPEPAVHRALNGAMKEWEVYKKLQTI